MKRKDGAWIPAVSFIIFCIALGFILLASGASWAQGSPPVPYPIDSLGIATGTDSTLLRSYRTDSSAGLFMNGDLDMNSNDILNATVTANATTGDFEVFGNNNVWGMNNILDHDWNFDIDGAYGDPKNADTILEIPTFAWIDTDGLGDTVLWAKDSSCALHPSELYIPWGWNGYKYLLFHSPIPRIGGADSARFENPTFVVSNNGEDYAPFIDSFSTSPTYDSLTTPIVIVDDYSDNWATDPDFLADPCGFMDVDSTLWNVNMVGWSASSHVAVVMQYTQDGLNWYHTYNSGNDTFVIVDTTLSVAHGMMSPKLIRTEVEGSAKYYLYLIRNHSTPDTSWIIRYSSDYVCSSYVYDTAFQYESQMNFVAEKLWHFDLLQPGNQDLIMIGTFTDSGSGGSPSDGYIRIGHSHDYGQSWDWGDSNRVIDTTNVATTGWDSKYIYKTGGHLIHDGHNIYLSLIYSAKNATSSRWGTGRTYIRFSIDSNEVQDDELAESDIDWQYEWIYLNQVSVHGTDPASDLTLTFPQLSPLNSDTLSWLLTDSAGTLSATAYDSFKVEGYVPYACTIDSLQYTMIEDGGGTYIDTTWFLGPDAGDAMNMTDSIYWSEGTNQLSATWVIKGFTFSNDISASAGDRFAVMFQTRFAATDDNKIIRIGWIRMRIRR